MHKKYLTFAQMNGFNVEKNLLHGMVDDVFVTITPSGNLTTYYFSMSCPVATAIEPIRIALKATKLFRNPKIEQKGECINIIVANSNKALRPESMSTLVHTVIGVAKQHNAIANMNCVHCGKITDDIALFNGVVSPVCSGCAREIEELNANYKTSPVFYLTGFIGALLGAAIGSIPWIVVYLNGWIIGILAFLTGMGAFYGYKLFRGPKSRVTALVTIYAVSLLTILGVYFGIIAVMAFLSNVHVTFLIIVDILTTPAYLLEIGLALLIAFSGIVGVRQKVYTYTIPTNARALGKRPATQTNPMFR